MQLGQIRASGATVSKRGLVISCPVVLTADGSVQIKTASLDPQQVRTSLLFWDELDFPVGFFDIGGTADVDFLIEAGILKRSKIPAPRGVDYAEVFRRMIVDAFDLNNLREPGVWSIHTGEGGLSLTDDRLAQGRGLLVSLHEALPVPNHDVHLQDILDFRERRSAELLAVRHHIEAIYSRIVTSGDGDLTRRSEIEALDAAIQDHMKVASESGFGWRRCSLDAELNMTSGVTAGATALAAGQSLVWAALAGVAGSFAVTVGHSLKGRTVGPSPFRYVSRYHSELF